MAQKALQRKSGSRKGCSHHRYHQYIEFNPLPVPLRKPVASAAGHPLLLKRILFYSASTRSFIMNLQSYWIDIPANGDSFPGYLSLPKGGKGPGVVIVQEIFGVNAHIRSVADRYAAAGYVALAPDIFWRVEPR